VLFGNLGLTTPTLVLLALAGGLTMFVQTAFVAWIPSYLNRYYGLDPAKASLGAGLLILCAGVGMILGGALVDRLSLHDRVNRLRINTLYCLSLGLTLLLAFSLEPGIAQFVLIGVGLSVSASFLGPALAVAADVTPVSNHATTFAIVSLAYMLIGAAPGPYVTGWIADVTSLKTALFLVPLSALAGALFFFLASRTYLRDRDRLHRA
jgi:fucose permease